MFILLTCGTKWLNKKLEKKPALLMKLHSILLEFWVLYLYNEVSFIMSSKKHLL